MPVGTSTTRWTSTIMWSMSGKKTLLSPYLWPFFFTGILFLVAEFVNHSIMNVPGVVVVYKRVGIRIRFRNDESGDVYKSQKISSSVNLVLVIYTLNLNVGNSVTKALRIRS